MIHNNDEAFDAITLLKNLDPPIKKKKSKSGLIYLNLKKFEEAEKRISKPLILRALYLKKKKERKEVYSNKKQDKSKNWLRTILQEAKKGP